MLIDRDGDAANNGTGFGKPAKDLSINFVPVPYPDYPPAVDQDEAGRKAAMARSECVGDHLSEFGSSVQSRAATAGTGGSRRRSAESRTATVDDVVAWQTHLGLPPGARVEFIVKGPPAGVTGLLVTRTVDTGPGGENDPNRAIATIAASADAPEPRSTLAASPKPLPPPSVPWLGSVAPVRTRKLYFSEEPLDPNNPNGPTRFYLTVDGQTPAVFDPNSSDSQHHRETGNGGGLDHREPVERTARLSHSSIALHAARLRWEGRSMSRFCATRSTFPTTTAGRCISQRQVADGFSRSEYRGTFVYHCHLLEHEDGGMMGLIRVEPAGCKRSKREATVPSQGERRARRHVAALGRFRKPAPQRSSAPRRALT